MAEQFAVGGDLRRCSRVIDAAIFQDNHVIARPKRRQSMRQDDECPSHGEANERVINKVLGVVVEGNFWLLDDQDRRIVEIGASQCDPELLIGLEVVAQGSDDRVVAVGKILNEMVGMSDPWRPRSRAATYSWRRRARY